MYSLSNGVLSLSEVVSSLLSTSGQLLLLERREASAVRPGLLRSEILGSELGTLVRNAGGITAFLRQNGEDFGDTLPEDSDLLEVHLSLGRHLLDAELGELFL